MGWINALYDTYQYLDQESKKPNSNVSGLVPPAVITQNAQVCVVLDDQSIFVRANMIEKDSAPTNTPVTWRSAARTSKPEPHAVFDNLMYLCGDMKDYLDGGKAEECYEKFFLPYMENLKRWKDSSYSNPNVEIIYNYLVKEQLLKDLVEEKIVKLKENRKIDEDLKYLNIPQNKYFVRFSIQMRGDNLDLWEDFSFINSYSDYLLALKNESSKSSGFCYATGKTGAMADLHGKYIRFPGDGAKLMSSNDSSNFTYRGRFDEPDQAYQVSYEVSEKAHSALRYLIQKRASTFKRNGMTVVAWANGSEIPMSGEDTYDMMSFLLDGDQNVATEVDTNQDFAYELKKALNSFKNKLETKTVNVMMLDAATPGRMAVQYFKQFDIDDYLDNIFRWHRELCWIQYYKKEGDEKLREYRSAPSVYDICLYSFGVEQNGKMVLNEKDKFVNQKIRRLFPCIIEGQRLPVDYMRGAYHNAVNPVSKEEYNWIKCLGVACSLIQKYYIDRGRSEYSMALNEQIKDRSYLFGRLLAIADKVERIALNMKKEDRPTSAKRLMNAFSKKPYSTWGTIELKLKPYFDRINPAAKAYYEKELNHVMDMIEFENYQNNRPLEPSFLLGYHNQLQKFSIDSRVAKQDNKGNGNEEENTNVNE